MVGIDELQKQFQVREVDPYGQVVVVPYHAFQHQWEKDLEAQGYRVFTESYEGQVAFFVRLSKSKVKTEPSSVAKSHLEHEARYLTIPLALLESSSQAPREIFEDIEQLTGTIKQHGLLEPLIITTCKGKNRYQVLIGERRFRACKKAELSTVPCLLMDGLNTEEIEELQLIENVQRRDLRPFEKIKLIRQLSDRGLTQHEICTKVGLSHGTVDSYLKISRALPIEIQHDIVEEGSHSPKDLTLTKAVMLAESKADSATVADTVKLIRKEGLKPKALAQKLAQQGETKLHRVREARVFWKELTRTLRRFAEYWDAYSTLKEYEEPDAYCLELRVRLPKDLKK